MVNNDFALFPLYFEIGAKINLIDVVLSFSLNAAEVPTWNKIEIKKSYVFFSCKKVTVRPPKCGGKIGQQIFQNGLQSDIQVFFSLLLFNSKKLPPFLKEQSTQDFFWVGVLFE